MILRPLAQLLESAGRGQPVPRLAKGGATVVVAGLLVDLVAHSVVGPVDHGHAGSLAAFPIEEHLAHLVVVLGMVLVLAGVVADGIRSQRRVVRQEGTARHAVR